jgi:hypothetical protein
MTESSIDFYQQALFIDFYQCQHKMQGKAIDFP